LQKNVKIVLMSWKDVISLVVLLTILGNLTLHAQISGTAATKDKDPVPFATVILKKATDSTISAYTQTDQDGKFNLKLKETGDFFLSVKSLSYATPM
jgi:hypothetical protein